MTMPQRNWWHELNTWEPEIALAFYGRTLGWQFEASPLPDGAAYWIARKDGKPVGGIFELTAPDYSGVPSHWMTYMSVGDINKAETDTAKAGVAVRTRMGSLPVSYSFRQTAASAGVTKASISPVMPEADIFFSSAAV